VAAEAQQPSSPPGNATPGPSGGLGLVGTGSSGPPKPHLAPEVIRQVMRASYDLFRKCYEAGLGRNPQLTGRVVIRFVITQEGTVRDVTDHGSDIPDPEVVACVQGVYFKLRFPKPEGGIVTVVYPIRFSPG